MNQIKELIKEQIKLERMHSKQNAGHMMRMFLKPFKDEIQTAADNLMLHILSKEAEDYQYMVKGELRIREDLIEVHETLINKDLSELMYKLLTVVVPKGRVTLQQAVGALIGSFKSIESVSRQLKAVNLVIEFCPLLELDITKGAEFGYLDSMVQLDKEELDVLNQQSVTLPSIVPLRQVRNNSSIGYRTVKKSVIMGGKHHDYDARLPHINKRNRIAFRIDKDIAGRMLAGNIDAFDPTPKINKKTGKIETKQEVEERKASYLDLHHNLMDKIKPIVDRDIYFSHRKDNRGRTYVEAYHLNYQGSDAQKALVNLAKTELIAEEW